MQSINWRAGLPALALACVLTLAGCGGGEAASPTGSTDPGGPQEQSPGPDPTVSDPSLQAPKNLALHYDGSQLALSWEPQQEAATFQVLEDPDGPGPEPAVAIATTEEPSFSRTLTLLMRLKTEASYTVRACTQAACSPPSDAVRPEPDSLVTHLKKKRSLPGEDAGWAVALSADGSTLAMSVPAEATVLSGIVTDSPGDGEPALELPTGAVVVFTRAPSNGKWRQQAIIKPLNPWANFSFDDKQRLFGGSISLSADGSMLVVGSAGDSSAAAGINSSSSAGLDWTPSKGESGAVHVFTRSGEAWSEQAYIKRAHPQTQDLFGASVAVSSDGRMLVVGAPQTYTYAGSVHLFHRDEAGGWMAGAELRASNTESGDRFGSALALSQDARTLAVSAPFEHGDATAPMAGAPSDMDTGSMGWEVGAAYVFTLEDSSWRQQAYIKGSQLRNGDGFGSAIALSADGSTLAVGSSGDDGAGTGEAGLDNAGAAYVFRREENVWRETADLKAVAPQAQSGFGARLALSADGKLLAVGSQARQVDSLHAGAVFLYGRGEDERWSGEATVTPRRPKDAQRFGAGVALSGDGAVLAVGAPGDGEPGAQAPGGAGPGGVYVY